MDPQIHAEKPLVPFLLGAEVSGRALCRALGMTPAGLKQWHRLGVVPRPPFHGPRTRYPRALAARVVAVRKLRQQGLGLEAAGQRLGAMSDAEVSVFVGPPWFPVTPEQAAGAVLARTPPLPPAYPARGWHRVVLVPGVELWVDAEGPAALRQLAARVWEHFGSPEHR